MSVRRFTKTFDYRHPNWHPDSVWTLRSEKQGKDDEAVAELQTRTVTTGIDWDRVREAQRKGDPIEGIIAAGVRTETVMSPRIANLFHYTVGWSGSDFTLPEDYVKGEEFGQPETDEDGAYVPHPLAGQPMPVSPEFIGIIDGEELADAERALTRAHAGRSAEEQEMFRDVAADRVRRSGSKRTAASK